VLQRFRQLAGDSLLVGHNVTFDIRFVNAARARLGAYEPLPNSFLCTQVVATRYHPSAASHKLGELCARFGISNKGAHRAGADVLMTAKLLQHLHAQRPITAELVNATGTSKSKAKAAATPTLFAA
jgi:DNA polymerase III epsilon subunit-like protein